MREIFPPSLEQLRKRKNSSKSTTPMKKLKHSHEENDDDSILLVDLNDSLSEYDDDKENVICDNWIYDLIDS